MSKNTKTVKHRVTESEQGRADLLIKKLLSKSRSEIRAIFAEGCIRKNGRICANAGEALKPGDIIEVSFDVSKRYKEKSPKYSSPLFKAVYEDNYIIVVDKQAGFLTQPTEDASLDTLLSAVSDYISVKSGRKQGVTLVHRLDRDTSGLLVLAKHLNLARSLKEQFAARKPEREYFAIVKGKLKKQTGTFKSFLATDEDLNQFSTNDEKKGKLAITHYKVIKQINDVSVINVKLETGRRNQIRVHFSESGHPVLGDVRYRAKLAKHPKWKWPRLALHAKILGFVHPVTKKKLRFTSPLPKEFDIFLEKL